jgi:hypothetical protein
MRKRLLIWNDWLEKNKRTVNIFLVIIIIIRFVILNYVNWSWGLLTSGTGGVQIGIDSYRYINGSDHLMNLKDYDKVYIGYISLISLIKFLGGGLETVLVVQLILAVLASVALFDLGRSITGSKTIGIIAAGLFLSNPYTTTWHMYIHTESIYFSFLIFSVWILNKTLEKRQYKYYILTLITILFTATIRQNGWVMIPIMLFFFIWFSDFKKQLKYISVFLVIVSFFLSMAFIPLLNQNIQDVPAIVMLLKGGVIFGRDDVNIKMPEDKNLEQKNWTNAYSYIAKHPIACVKLAICRVATELLPINRPWQTLKFKIRFLIWLLPGYFLAIFGIRAFRRKSAYAITLTVIVAHLCVIALTHADYEWRFLFHVLPLIYLLSACGLYAVYNKYLQYLKHN